MDVLDALVDDVGPALRDVVHHPADRLLVAGNLPRREHHDVVLVELRVPVVVDRDPRQRRLRLALRPGADDRRRPATGSRACRCRGSAPPAEPAGIRAAARSASSRCTPRPTNATLRSNWSARSTRICIRYRLDENIATTIRPRALVKTSSKPSMTSRSEPLTPLRSTFVLSPSSDQHAFGAELREALKVHVLRRRAGSGRS